METRWYRVGGCPRGELLLFRGEDNYRLVKHLMHLCFDGRRLSTAIAPRITSIRIKSLSKEACFTFSFEFYCDSCDRFIASQTQDGFAGHKIQVCVQRSGIIQHDPYGHGALMMASIGENRCQCLE